MGRPLNKKYFGNRNIGRNGREGIEFQNGYNGDGLTSEGHEVSTSYPLGDDGIGGEGIAGVAFGASVADTSYGSGAYLDRMPVVSSINKPTLPGGVQAVAAVTHVQAVHGNPNVSGTPNGADYLTGDILTVTTGTAATPAKFTVGALQVSGFTIVAGNDGNTSHGYAVGDPLNFANGVVLTVATINSSGYPTDRGVVTSCTLTNTGSYTGTTPPTGTVGHTNTLGGQGCTVNFSWGVKSVTVLQAGDYTAVASNASATTVTHGDLTASSATGCTLDIWYGIKTITVSEKGSGYTGAETITFSATTDGSETRATGTITLTQDTGAVGSATNQENAIIAYVYQDDERKIADIVKQTGSRRYVFITSGYIEESTDKEDEAVQGYLVAHLADAPDEANITATDSAGKEYWVTKLTNGRARLARKDGTGGYVYATGNQAPWSFTTTANGRVIIENA